MHDSPGAADEDAGSVDRALALRQLMRPLQDFLDDDAVREIAINRPGALFLRRGGDWHSLKAPWATLGYLDALVSAMASFNEVEHAAIMSLKLPNGERGQVARFPAVIEGTLSLNIRKHASVVKTLEMLEADGAFSDWADASHRIRTELTNHDRELLRLKAAGDIPAFLSRAVQYRKNILVAGKTGSGKTTFARSLIEKVDTGERLITIEDVHELYLPNHANRVHMIYGDAHAHVSTSDCLAACMRSSPDRIFLAELRGPEAWEYLQALNTGHPGTVTTTHANSAFDAYDRVAFLVKQSEAGRQLDLDTIRRYLTATLDIVLYFSHFRLVEIDFDPERAARA